MKLLLDTHTFLWFVSDCPKLSDYLKALIEDTNNVSYLSVASLWEMSIKFNLGKLTLDPNYEEFIEREITTTSIQILDIKLEHLRINAIIPFHHKDPFDRRDAFASDRALHGTGRECARIAQSMAENIPIVTVDSAFNEYKVTLIN